MADGDVVVVVVVVVEGDVVAADTVAGVGTIPTDGVHDDNSSKVNNT